MTVVQLPAGTDVAETALFDVDAIPQVLSRHLRELDQISSNAQLVRFPTGADGGYLLHLFVDEAMPEHTKRYCSAEDGLTGDFYTSAGRIAFGGLESAYGSFKPNANIRSDGVISPGRYTYTAYRTEFPDDVFAQAMKFEQSAREKWAGRLPMLATLALVPAVFFLTVSKHLALAVTAAAGGILAVKALKRLPAYQDFAARREQAQLAFPSIVIELRSIPPAGTT